MEKLKKEADKLMKIEGMTTGSEFLSLVRHIEEKYGEEKTKFLEKEMEKLGYPCSFERIRPAHWYRESLSVLAMVVAKNLFGWRDLFDFGYRSPAFSFGVKVFIKLLPPPLFFNQVPKIWKKFLDVGSLEISQYSEKRKRVVVRLKNYMFHPDMCPYFAGFFLKIAEYVIKHKKIKIEETKCMHRGDPYHEFIIKWE